MKPKFVVLFAGCVGSSKSPIAYYLSERFGLPIFNADALRTEVIEDFGRLDETEFEKRRDMRLKEIASKGKPFILDASIDRKWETLGKEIESLGYEKFVVSLDLSKEMLTRLYEHKGYHESLKVLDQLLDDHKNFLGSFGQIENVRITDWEFPNRLKLVGNALESWMIRWEHAPKVVSR